MKNYSENIEKQYHIQVGKEMLGSMSFFRAIQNAVQKSPNILMIRFLWQTAVSM